MICNKKIIVFVKKGDPLPGGDLLGILKITPAGSTIVLCADNLQKKDYPSGWLYVTDKNNNVIETNQTNAGSNNQTSGTAQAGQPAKNQGWNPFGLFDVIDLSFIPSWMWILLAGIIVYKIKK